MRGVLLLVVLSILAWLGSSTPVDREEQHINRDTRGLMARLRRSPYEGAPNGGPLKGRDPAMGLRKGEYICGTGVCELQPGEIPSGCNGICQYRLGPHD